MTAQDTELRSPLYGASFGQAIRRFFKKYATFSGRASRSEYWWIALFIALLQIIPSILTSLGFDQIMEAAAGGSDPQSIDSVAVVTPWVIGVILTSVISLALLIPSLAIVWRRLHDTNRSGGFFFLSLIPFVGSFIVLILTLLPSNPEGARFDN